ncbi:MAG: acetyl-CoA carboxylase biotin carboxyl carrier protein subunit [Alphaproteobacteria bacterium]|nr:acetyl-CoA carboxylase biotin carboxyl carrier protein subunit [Alphaproteobacteria bacterium]MCY4231295.1 acetyl-CoA carboxylase biotin carboxyl carrier protein subunit [Alphaproteobacteria bacterium]MCY4318769.1 acetyl-CoA carboxylase biotin carboxyl carrier protein subunit [Alphaproteobacteria bacterium]
MSRFEIDEDAVRLLAGLLEETGVAEIEYRDGDRSLRIAARGIAQAPAPAEAAAPPQGLPTGAAPHPQPIPAAAEGTAVTAPIVGTVYLQPEPGQPAFVQVGDRVQAGQTLLIIEAMKVYNQIPAPSDGVVRQILVSSGAPVEYAETLMILG